MTCPNGHAVTGGALFCQTCGLAVSSTPPQATPTTWPATPPPAAPAVPAPAPSGLAPYGQAPSYPAPSYPAPSYPAAGVPALATSTPSRTMYTVAAVINWVVLGIIAVSTAGIGLICAAWFVPMTIQMHKGAKGPYKHTGLGVCTLLFCNIVSGILLLADDSGKPPKPVRA